MSTIAADLQEHPERRVVWHFPRGVSVVCTESRTTPSGRDAGQIDVCYVATEYIPGDDLLTIRNLNGYVDAKRFKLR